MQLLCLNAPLDISRNPMANPFAPLPSPWLTYVTAHTQKFYTLRCRRSFACLLSSKQRRYHPFTSLPTKRRRMNVAYILNVHGLTTLPNLRSIESTYSSSLSGVASMGTRVLLNRFTWQWWPLLDHTTAWLWQRSNLDHIGFTFLWKWNLGTLYCRYPAMKFRCASPEEFKLM